MSFLKKFLGLALLFLGLAVIFYGIYSSFNIFTAKTSAPEIFEVEEQVLAEKSEAEGVEAQLQQMIGEQLKGIIPVGSMSITLNLISWSIFAGILILAGAQISGLGIKLIT